MAVPPPILPPEQNTARALGRLSPGVARSRAGLAPVQRVGTTAKASSSSSAQSTTGPLGWALFTDSRVPINRSLPTNFLDRILPDTFAESGGEWAGWAEWDSTAQAVSVVTPGWYQFGVIAQGVTSGAGVMTAQVIASPQDSNYPFSATAVYHLGADFNGDGTLNVSVTTTPFFYGSGDSTFAFLGTDDVDTYAWGQMFVARIA